MEKTALMDSAVKVSPVTVESGKQFGLSGFIRFVTIATELLLISLAVTQFQVEQELGFPRIMSAILAGFLINHLLPFKYRQPFFFVLFVVTLTIMTSSTRTAAIVVLGMSFIAICHLRLSFWLRVAMILGMASILAAIRLNWIATDWGDAVVPVVASMFMFRLILYLFEMRQGNIQDGWWKRINYFFLLPNICFPLFPIIGYRTFLESYYNEDPYTIYQKGIRWMVWGLLQLLAYRVIYYYWVPAPSDVVDAGSLVLYFVTAYTILLKIAGQAYLILGILCLFGWNLPPMFNHYFLASGFSDLWRRVNLYWKEFMMKVFYYPVYFVFRHRGLLSATMISLIFAFFLTWVLHSYQYFWIQGSFPVTTADGVFWGLFGISVAISSTFQLKHKQRKNLGVRPWKFSEAAKKSVKVVLFFSFMCILFSFWGSGSISEWFAVVSAVRVIASWQWGVISGVLLSAILIGAVVQYPFSRSERVSVQPEFFKAAIWLLIVVISVLIIRNYRYYTSEDSAFRRLVVSVEKPGWNRRDAEVAERGYYEPLLGKNAVSADLMIGERRSPRGWIYLHETDAARQIKDLLGAELIPGKKIKFRNQLFSINSHGMRDKEYTLEKPPRTYRFALLGSSNDMGNGIGDAQTYESLVEKQLNHHNRSNVHGSYEILNFSMNGYDFIRYVRVCETKIFRFQPDVLIVVGHPGDQRRVIERLIWAARNVPDLEDDVLKEITKRWGFYPGMERTEAEKRLLPYGETILQWALKRIAANCEKNHAIPVYLFLPLHDRKTSPEELKSSLDMAKRFGFVTIDLSKALDGYEPKTLQIAPWDVHLNPEAHRLIAQSLYEKLLMKQEVLGISPNPSVKSDSTLANY